MLTGLAVAILAGFLTPSIGAAQQGNCGIAADLFQVDGQVFSSASYTDWAQGPAGQGVFDAAGDVLIGPALRVRDGYWAGGGTDYVAFAGSGNKNNDDISADADPWQWGKGSGPAKNDLTDVFASSAMVNGELWLFLGAQTRSNNGASHVDFEISQAGFLRTGDTKGNIVGLGPDAGRTAGVDFIVSVDYLDGGTVPFVSFRTWQNTVDGLQFVETAIDPSNVFICTNDMSVPAPPWGAVAPDGSITNEIVPYQFVEMGLNLTALGIDPAVFCTDLSTLMFKTRSSPSFSAELKDLSTHPFNLIPVPPSRITPNQAAYCVGDVAQLCAPATPADANYVYEWSGPGGPYGDTPCIETSVAGTYQLVVHDLESGCASAVSTFDLVMELPPSGITADLDTICTGTTTWFHGPDAPAGVTYRYDWTGPGGPYPDASSIEVSEAGTYTLTVTNVVTGCPGETAERTLTLVPLPVASIAGAALICAETTTELCGPDGNYDYAWEGPSGALPNSACITVSEPGAYTLVLTDLTTGCVSSPATHVLTVDALPVASIVGPRYFCPGTEVELCGPEGEFSYVWTGPDASYPDQRCIVVGTEGAYSLTVINGNGCSSSTTYDLVAEVPQVGTIAFDTAVICQGGVAEFCGPDAPDGAVYRYDWTGPDGSSFPDAQCIDVKVAGTYTLTVTNLVTGCAGATGQQVLTVNPLPVAAVTGPALICAGESTDLCGPEGDFDYAWEGPAGPYPTDRCITVSEEGAYTLTITRQTTGCVSVPVTHDLAVVPVPVASIEGPDSFCLGTSTELSGPVGDLVYVWEGPNGSFPDVRTITADTPGTYTLTVINPNGCRSSAEHVLTLDEPLSVTGMDDLYLCTGTPGSFCVEATGTGPITYVWFRNGDRIEGASEACLDIPSIGVEDAGVYTVEVAGKCGDPITMQASLTLADVAVAGVSDLYLCEGKRYELCPTVSGMGPFTYEWVDLTRGFVASRDECLVFDPVRGTHEGRYSLTVRGACGVPVIVEFDVLIGRCQQFCSKSKGFWGNSGGTWYGWRTSYVLRSIVTHDNPIVLGKKGLRSLTIPAGSEQCVIEFLPADGPAMALPASLGDAVVDSLTCGVSLGLTDQNGRLSNGLLAATLVTELNTRIDPDLPEMRICETMITVPALPGPDGIIGTADDVPDSQNPRFMTVPPSLLDALAAMRLPDSVGGLLELANLALAGAVPVHVPLDLNELEKAMSELVVLTHDCAFVIECEYPIRTGGGKGIKIAGVNAMREAASGQQQQSPNVVEGAETGGLASSLPDRAYLSVTNPVRSSSGTIRFGLTQLGRATIVVYDIRGRMVSRMLDQQLAAGHHTLNLDIRNNNMTSTGVYFVRMSVQGAADGSTFHETRKIVVIR